MKSINILLFSSFSYISMKKYIAEHRRSHFSGDEENRFPRVQYIEFWLFNINNYLNDFYSLDIKNK